jgi:hypothetical protein
MKKHHGDVMIINNIASQASLTHHNWVQSAYHGEGEGEA